MIRRRTSEAGGGVLSFTFLDVLTCTMGSLVLLLVVLAQKAKDVTLEEALANAGKPKAPVEQLAAPAKDDRADDSKVAADAERDATPLQGVAPEAQLAEKASQGEEAAEELEQFKADEGGLTAEELEKRLAEVREKKREIEKSRREVAQKARDEEARVSHLEEHERRLEIEVAKLKVALERLEEAEKKQSVDQEAADAELERLKEVIADAEKQIEELRKETVGKKSYAIVPYKGSNGTTRRPIYIECTKDAVTIYPEGIRLTAADFDGPLRSGNPLNAAIRAAREELNARAAAAGQTDLPDPYPLLIIRPDGAYAYGAALSAISSWDSDFGYEFVDADWKLEYPDPDPRLDQMMRHAVEQARQRQAMLAKAAPRRYGPRLSLGSGEGGGMGGDGSGGGGGFEGVAHPGGDGDRIGDHNGENWMAVSGAGGGTGTTTDGGNRYASTEGTNIGVNGGATPGTLAGTPKASTGYGGQGAGGAEIAMNEGGAGAEGGEAGGAAGVGPNEGVAGANGAYGTANQTGADAARGVAATSAGTNVSTGDASSGGASGGATGATASAGAAGSAGGANSSSAASGGASGAAISYSAGQTQSAATSRGANWANSAAGRRASAINRPIRVVVHTDQLEVMPTNQGGSGPIESSTAITFHQQTDMVLDQLAATIQQRMKEWGLAGNGMYWRPTLVLQVDPGAEQHAIRLNDLLRDSGLDVQFQEVALRTEQGAGHGTTR